MVEPPLVKKVANWNLKAESKQHTKYKYKEISWRLNSDKETQLRRTHGTIDSSMGMHIGQRLLL